MLPWRVQNTHKWRTTKHTLCSRLATQILGMTEYTQAPYIVPTHMHKYTALTPHCECYCILAHTQRSQKRKSHMEGAGAGEALIYFECSTSISSTHKPEPNRGKLHSLGARNIKQRELDLSQTLPKSPKSCISPLHYVNCLSCQWHCMSPVPSLQLLSLNVICKDQRIEECYCAASVLSPISQ